jgi:hypothetical protein
LLMLAQALTACAPISRSKTLSNATDLCAVFAPIRASKLDTVDTRAQVANHNAKGMVACGWRP